MEGKEWWEIRKPNFKPEIVKNMKNK